MNKEYITRKTSAITLNITDGKVDSFREIDETTKTVRVYSEGKIGVAGALGEVSFDDVEKRAVKKLGDGVSYACALNNGVKKSIVNDKLVIEKNNLLPAVKRVAKKVALACPRFLVNGKVKLAQNHSSYKNSENTELESKNSDLAIFLEVKDRDSSNISDAFFEFSTGRYGKSVEEKIVNDMKILHDNFFTKPITLPNGEYHIIGESTYIFNHILKDFVAEYYVSGGSLFNGKLGEKVFNENLSLYVDRNPKTSRNSAFFDDEGEFAKNYRVPLIEKGVMKNLFTNKNSASIFNLPLSKTAGGEYDGVPSISLPKLYVEPTAPDLKTLLGDKKAIWISISSGGDITNEGVVGMPVMLAFLVENGQIKGRVANFNATGNIFEMLGNNFIGVSKQNLMTSLEESMIVSKMKIIND